MNKKLIFFIIAVTALIAASLILPVKQWLVALLDFAGDLGAWAPGFIILIYITACLLFVPGSIITLGTGFLLGFTTGTITVSIGSTLGACAAFLAGRTFARGWIEEKVIGNERFIKLDRALGEQGFKIVLLLRLSPVFPFNLLNYALGLTRINFSRYAAATWIGMLPGAMMYTYIGAGVRSLTEAAAGDIQTGTAGRIFFWAGLVFTVAVVLFVTRTARKALDMG